LQNETQESKEVGMAHQNIWVCEDKHGCKRGDTITWHNLRDENVTVYFDIDGCPLVEVRECQGFLVPANRTHDNTVSDDAKNPSYTYRVEPDCGKLGNPKIIIQK
jgi:hypothetical protein